MALQGYFGCVKSVNELGIGLTEPFTTVPNASSPAICVWE